MTSLARAPKSFECFVWSASLSHLARCCQSCRWCKRPQYWFTDSQRSCWCGHWFTDSFCGHWFTLIHRCFILWSLIHVDSLIHFVASHDSVGHMESISSFLAFGKFGSVYSCNWISLYSSKVLRNRKWNSTIGKILAAISVVAAPLSNPFRGNPSVVLATIVSYITVQNIGIILSYLLMHQTLSSLLKTRWKSFTDFVLAEASHCWFGTFITVTVFKTLCFTLLQPLLSKDLRIKPTTV